MFDAREPELRTLTEYENRDGSQVLILYGQSGIGKTTLLKNFLSKRANTCYLEAMPLSEREQLFQWSRLLGEEEKTLPRYCSYQDIFSLMVKNASFSDKKIIIVFDEFQNLCKNSMQFMDTLFEFLQTASREFFIVLSSSSVEWIENSMIGRIGQKAKMLSGFLKLKDLSFQEFIRYFKNFTFKECIEGYAILGGVPYLWEQFDQKLSLSENIQENILDAHSLLNQYGNRFVARQLRETGVYNTILCALSMGIQKLNDLYLHTGFSRAKISVYLKNLMELGIVEKEFSFDSEGRENAQKGIYGICNHYVDFTYQFLFPYQQEQETLEPEAFYLKRIAPGLKEYTAKHFSTICKDYMELQNLNHRLPISYTRFGKWLGKAGTIDFVAQDETGVTILGLCNWEQPMMRYEDYEWLLFCAKQAKLGEDYVYLFSAGGFDEKLRFAQASKKNIYLLTLENL